MSDTTRFKGLLYVKHGRVGSRSEGPDYWLQTYGGDYLLHFHERNLWQPDYQLEFHARRMVEVEGKLENHTVYVARIWAIPGDYIPREDSRPHLGDPVRLPLGERVRLADAPVEIAFLEVLEDSRCPTGAQCVWTGEAVIAVEVAVDGAEAQRVKLTLRPGNDELARATVGHHVVALRALDPYPTLERLRNEPRNYIATLVVSRA